MANPYSLEGKLVLVTGSGIGIGLGIALEAARQGADVALHYASHGQGALEAVAQIEALGRRAIAIQADLREVSECFRLVDEAAAYLGGLDGLVNTAGVTITQDFLETSEDLFNRTFNLNIRGQFFCTQQAVRHMTQRGAAIQAGQPDRPWAGGSVVNISSVHGSVGCPGHSVYASTKGAINAWSRELAVELTAVHIRVNVLAPGSVEVPHYWDINPSYSRALGNSMVPWGRVGLPADMGYMAVFLLSDASEFLTGQVINMDGGLTAKMALPYQPPVHEG
jgi:NAD(P)-dependent dehydrogenase (short-subunit alcohol dehydrogenase family)